MDTTNDTPYFPRLDDVIHAEDVQVKGGGKFAAEYVNWARLSSHLREHAPGWQPDAVHAEDGGMSHQAPNGSRYLMIRFVHYDGRVTLPVPHAIMDTRNSAMPGADVDARDISDAFVRGMCKAAAMVFGLGWKLWSKEDPLSRKDDEPAPRTTQPPADPSALPYVDQEDALHAVGSATNKKQLAEVWDRIKATAFGNDIQAERDNPKFEGASDQAILAAIVAELKAAMRDRALEVKDE